MTENRLIPILAGSNLPGETVDELLNIIRDNERLLEDNTTYLSQLQWYHDKDMAPFNQHFKTEAQARMGYWMLSYLKGQPGIFPQDKKELQALGKMLWGLAATSTPRSPPAIAPSETQGKRKGTKDATL